MYINVPVPISTASLSLLFYQWLLAVVVVVIMTAEDRTVHNTPGTGGRTDIDTSRGIGRSTPSKAYQQPEIKESSGNNSAGDSPKQSTTGIQSVRALPGFRLLQNSLS